MLIRTRQTDNSFDFVGHIAEAARLAAISVHREIFTAERLRNEVRDYTAIIFMQSRTVSIKDSHYVGVDSLVPMVGHHQRLREALGFVIHRARPDWIHVPPIVFPLRMDCGITVAL